MFNPQFDKSKIFLIILRALIINWLCFIYCYYYAGWKHASNTSNVLHFLNLFYSHLENLLLNLSNCGLNIEKSLLKAHCVLNF